MIEPWCVFVQLDRERCGMSDSSLLQPQDRRQILRPGLEVAVPSARADNLLIESGFVASLVSMPEESRTCVGLLGRGGLIRGRPVAGGLRWSYFTLSEVAVWLIPPSDKSLSSARLQAQESMCVSQLALVAMCNARHHLAQRCAQWLMRFEHYLGSTIRITHAFLAEIIGVRRSGISTVLHAWQQEGVITQGHGQITVLDREGLRQKACSCPMIAANPDSDLSAIRLESEQLLQPSGICPPDRERPDHPNVAVARQLSVEFAQERAKLLRLQQITYGLMHGVKEEMTAIQGELQKTSLGLQRAQSVLVGN